MEKTLLREKLKKLRNAIPGSNRKKLDKLIEKNVLSMKEFQEANSVMFYVSFNSEANTKSLIKTALKQGKIVSVPKVSNPIKKEMLAIKIKDISTDLKSGYCRILEPKSIKDIIKPEKIDLVFVPGVGFDVYGRRLGYGGGFYDNFLRKIPLKKRVGIAYEIQIVDKLPSNKSDIQVNKVVTEKGVMRCQKQ